ncbi:hypothetical protein [Bathymodiolus thermophilus thioautotrophic gill symbiont]|uniref:hypothetical protein n=1 Tax=Bathymodiolus thermophilus thioautotrophic gill symbiont TaxID=2360 RepID=UPI0013DFE522|nr:hypothetical protein [Bathymodiolus thermophilus thioautotrophic gill symbiont]
MNTLHYIIMTPYRLATSGLNSSQTTLYFPTLIIRLVNRSFFAFIACIAIVEKKHSIFKTISSTPLSIAPLHHKTSNTCAKKNSNICLLPLKHFYFFKQQK